MQMHDFISRAGAPEEAGHWARVRQERHDTLLQLVRQALEG